MPRVTRLESRNLTRKRLRTAAFAEFTRRGYAATSIDLISETAGFSRGAFYANYQSKQELLLELMAENHEQEALVWQDLVEHADDIEVLLGELERRFNDYATRRDWWLLYAELQLEAERDGRFGQLYRGYGTRLIERLDGLMTSLLAKAGGSPDIDPQIVSLALRALSHGLMFEAGHRPEAREPGKAITLFLRAILSLCPSLPRADLSRAMPSTPERK